MIKLHLGCGEKRIDGFINIDSRYLPTVDKVDNIRFLRSFEDNSIDLIYSSHVLEHFSRWDYHQCLKRWYDLLKPGALLRIAVPDFAKIARHYIEFEDVHALSGMIYGGQDYPENNHFWCWDFNELKKDLEKTGFRNIQRYDWRETEHSHIDDCSQAYLPHLEKEEGWLRSLNVEGIK